MRERTNEERPVSEFRAASTRMPRAVHRGLVVALGLLGLGALVLVAFRGEAMLLDLASMVASFCL